jgi:hypothetical protein
MSDADRGEAITTFLCDQHFLRAFSSRHDPPSDACADSDFAFHANQNNVVRGLSQAFPRVIANVARA